MVGAHFRCVGRWPCRLTPWHDRCRMCATRRQIQPDMRRCSWAEKTSSGRGHVDALHAVATISGRNFPCLPAREGLETMGAQPHRDGSGCWKATSRFASAPNDAAHRCQEPVTRPVQLHPNGCLFFLHTIHCFGCLAFAVHAMQAKAYVSLSMMKLIWLLPLEVAREIQRAVLACTPHKRSGLFTRAEASPVRLDTHDTTASTTTAIARLRYGRGHRVQSRVATR